MVGVQRVLKNSGRHIRTTLIAGLLLIIPVAVTFIILRFIFDFFDGLLEPFLDQFLVDYTPGMGIAALVIVIYLAGLVTTHILGRRLVRLGNNMVDRIPVVRSVYRTARQATDVLSAVSSSSGGQYSSVVLVDFPGYGLRSIGLVTSKIKDKDDNTLLVVYMPTSPFPTSGFLVILPEERVTPTDIAVDDAIKMIVSAGVVAPDKITAYPGPFGPVPPPTGFPFSPQYQGPSERDHPSDNRASNQ